MVPQEACHVVKVIEYLLDRVKKVAIILEYARRCEARNDDVEHGGCRSWIRLIGQMRNGESQVGFVRKIDPLLPRIPTRPALGLSKVRDVCLLPVCIHEVVGEQLLLCCGFLPPPSVVFRRQLLLRLVPQGVLAAPWPSSGTSASASTHPAASMVLE